MSYAKSLEIFGKRIEDKLAEKRDLLPEKSARLLEIGA